MEATKKPKILLVGKCVCVCARTHTRVCTHACVCMCMYTCAIQVCTCVCMHLLVCMCMHAFVCTRVCVNVCVGVHVCIRLGQAVAGAQGWESMLGVGQQGRSHRSGEGTGSAGRKDRHVPPRDCKVQVYNLILNIQFF